jgi:DNA-binding protein HU-beta
MRDFALSPYIFKPHCAKTAAFYTDGVPLCPTWLRVYKLKRTMANKADIVSKVQQTLGSTKADAERAVETMISEITMYLKKGDEVSVAGLGIFATKARPAREGRNPRTGETIRIAATRTPKFRPAKALKDAVK